MPKDIVGFGVVGCGRVAQVHGRALNAATGAQLISAVDMNQERLARFCAEFHCECASSFDTMLADPRVDAISVLTPSANHALFALPALQAKKHVIVERPPEMTLEKTDAMIAAAKASGVKLQVSLQVRFRKGVEAIKTALDAGRFGRLLSANAYIKHYRATEYYLKDEWRSKRDEGAGVTIQHAFHYIDLLHYLLGPVTAVEAKMRNLTHPGVELEDTLHAFLTFKSGAFGIIEASTALYPGSEVRVEIWGENGTAIMEGERLTTWQFHDEQLADMTIRTIGGPSGRAAPEGVPTLSPLEHKAMIENFVRAIKYDQPLRVACESTRGSLEIALAMYRSADAGREVNLPW